VEEGAVSDDYGPSCGNCEWRTDAGRCKVHKKPVSPDEGGWCQEHSVYFAKAVKKRFRREVLGERS
jgi:hypothetical protein